MQEFAPVGGRAKDLADVEHIVVESTDHGEDFHGQCGGLGFFALEMGMIITEETEQIVYTVEYAMRVDEVCVENVHIALEQDATEATDSVHAERATWVHGRGCDG
jgi:hypothetical protein